MAASRREVSVVYLAGIVQGIVLVTFPAASTIFTDPDQYDLSNTRYGFLFVPQVLTAITASLLGSSLARRSSTKRVYLAGLLAGLVAMVLLLVSQFFESDSAAFPMLLVATAFLGVGFGLTVPALNTLTAAFHPQTVESSVLVLNALLGLGTALAPVFVAVFVGLGFWWGLPLTSAILLAALTAVSVALPLRADAPAQKGAGRRRARDPGPLLGLRRLRGALRGLRDPERKLVAARHDERAGRLDHGGGRRPDGVLGDGHGRPCPFRRDRAPGAVTPHLPRAAVPAGRDVRAHRASSPTATSPLGVLAFGLAGLGCSALLPLTIGFGQEELVSMSAAAAGGVIAFYQVGYGLAAFGVGPLLDHGVELPTVYKLAAFVAAGMGLVSLAVTRPRRRITATASRGSRSGRVRTRPCGPSGPGMSSSSRRPMPLGSAGSTIRWSPSGSRPSIVRSSSSGAPVDQACGLHAVGYWTGYLVSARS